MLLLSFLVACAPAGVKLDDTAGLVDSEDSGVDSGDSAETADSDSGEPDSGDSGDSGETAETGETAGTPAEVSDLNASIHPEIGSIVVLTWTQAGTGAVYAEFSVDDGAWLSTPTYTLGDGAQRLLLLGAPYDHDVTWRLVVDGTAVADDASIHTDDPPRGVPLPDDVEGALSDPETPYLLLSMAPGGGSGSPDDAWTFILDARARLVWALAAPDSRTTFMPMVAVTGDEILIDHNSWWGAFDGGVASQVARVDIEGSENGRYDTPGLIHPFVQKGDGSIVWGASLGSGRQGESLDILDPDGTHRTLWDCNSYARARNETVCGSNALYWDEETDDVLFSLYSAETIMQITPEGTVARSFGHMRDAWGWSAGSDEFYWHHGAQFLPDGHLMVSSRLTENAEETVVREYRLDEEREELVEVWSFGEDEGVWAYIMGEPHRLPGGDTLHNYGSTPRLREATPDGEVVWDVSWDDGGSLGRMTPLTSLYPLWGAAPGR